MLRIILIVAIISMSLFGKAITQYECMAEAIYFEARGSSYADQAAVADVIMNRVESKDFPNTVCKVVHQAKYSKWWLKTHNKLVPIRNKCQFSYYCDGKSDKIKDKDSYKRVKSLSFKVYVLGRFRGITEGATFYQAKYVDTEWFKTLKFITRIGSHNYYSKK